MSGYPGGPRNAEAVDVLWSALRDFPNGATAKTIAAKLGWKQTVASSRLGRLAMYGIVDRVPINVPSIIRDRHDRRRGSTREYRYSIKKFANTVLGAG